jgi:hypothetical protein
VIENVEIIHDGKDWKIAFDIAGTRFEEKPEIIKQTADQLSAAYSMIGVLRDTVKRIHHENN